MKIVMIGEQNAQQPTSGVLLRLTNTGADFPIHMLALPGAGTDQDHNHRRISDEVIANSLTNRGDSQIEVIDVIVMHRLVHNRTAHHLDESVSVLHILFMEADEDLMSRDFCGHHRVPGHVGEAINHSNNQAVSAVATMKT